VLSKAGGLIMANPGYNLSVNVIGAKELEKAFTEVGDYAKKVISQAINKTAYDLEKDARAKAPHKKGGLWNSIHTDRDPGHLARITGNNVEARVGTNLEYALAQEKGTKGMTINVKNGRRTKFGRTKPYTYTGNIPAKHYMRDAKTDMKPQLTSNLQEALRLIVTKLSTRGAAL